MFKYYLFIFIHPPLKQLLLKYKIYYLDDFSFYLDLFLFSYNYILCNNDLELKKKAIYNNMKYILFRFAY